MPGDWIISENEKLSLQDGEEQRNAPILVLGEVLWDVFDSSEHLGGAALNFAAHAKRLGCQPLLISAVGPDGRGGKAIQRIVELGLNGAFVQTSQNLGTGAAGVRLSNDGQASFEIWRPAAYDDISLSDGALRRLAALRPAWFYYGTLLPARSSGKTLLHRLVRAIPAALRFYDVNLRPGHASESLIAELLALAQVVKMNEAEMRAICEFTGLPPQVEAFCRTAAERYGWEAVCVTLGARGCAVLAHGEYAAADGFPVEVADTVGAGDAFAAAFLFGINCRWPALKTAAFANRIGAIVASRPGAVPDWTLDEIPDLQLSRSEAL